MLFPVLMLCTAGVLTLQATEMPVEAGLLADRAMRQLLYIFVGLAGMLAVMMVGYHRLGRWSYLLFAVCLVLLVYLLLGRWVAQLPLVKAIRGTRRWLFVGPIPLQPSELAKIAYVLALAWYLRYRRNYRTFMGLFVPFAITLVPMGLILIQPDLGTVLLFLPVLFAMLFAAGARVRHLLLIVCMGICCLPLFWLKIADYQRLRITGVLLQDSRLRDYLVQEPPASPEDSSYWDRVKSLFTEPVQTQPAEDIPTAPSVLSRTRPMRWDWLCPKGTAPGLWRQELVEWENRSGYQLVASKNAIGSGGLTGQGWGRGIFFEYDFLPEAHNDFIFALIAHQWGVLGSLVVLAGFALIFLVGLIIASLTVDPFGRLVAVGLATMILVQALVNLAMTIGFGPITGMTLPFVSAGGSSLMASFISIGLLVSVAQRRPRTLATRSFEFDDLE
ncbi:MAG: rod shape-determining protein RodA [Phycisphaerales bacterium]|nr:rod shape-determining protein RodA [Phycisphaerales bacterium]